MRPYARLLRALLLLTLLFLTIKLYRWEGWYRGATTGAMVNQDIASRLGAPGNGAVTMVGQLRVRKKRVVFVGDVHGMLDERITPPSPLPKKKVKKKKNKNKKREKKKSTSLKNNPRPPSPSLSSTVNSLLQNLAFNRQTDHLIFTGDLVSKGPDSLKVIDLAISQDASCVRGNHDDRLLLQYQHYRSRHPDDVLGVEGAEPSIRDEKKLARRLTHQQARWLDSCTVILKLGHVDGGLGETVVVHAGLVHGVELERQDPSAVMNMRSIDERLRVPSHKPDGKHWAALWNKMETGVDKPVTVV
jgi:hypothetical protein